MPKTLSGAVHAALTMLLRVMYMIFVAGLAYGSIALMDENDMMIVRAAVTKGFLVFLIAMSTAILALMFICWRFKIAPVRAFNVLENAKDNPTGLGLFLGLTVLGLCQLAASIFGAT